MNQLHFHPAFRIFICVAACIVLVDTLVLNVLLFASGFEHARIQKLIGGQVTTSHFIYVAAIWFFSSVVESAIHSFLPSAAIAIYYVKKQTLRLYPLIILGQLMTLVPLAVFFILPNLWTGQIDAPAMKVFGVMCSFLAFTTFVAILLAWWLLKARLKVETL